MGNGPFEGAITSNAPLCWFQTSLALATLPLCHVIIACCFRVAALSSNTALALSPSGIAPELNRIQLSAICRGGQSGKVIDLLACTACRLVIPLPQMALAQLYKYHHQCGEWQSSLKAALFFSDFYRKCHATICEHVDPYGGLNLKIWKSTFPMWLYEGWQNIKFSWYCLKLISHIHQ